MTAGHVLFIAHRIPYPPDKGDKIRSWHLLRHLASRFRVHLAAFVDDAADWQYRSALEEVCESVFLCPLERRTALLRSLSGLLRGEALSVPYYRHAAMRRAVERLLAEQPVDTIVVFSSAVAQYATGAAARRCLRLLDFVDVDSDKWQQYALHRRWPVSAVYRRESRKLLRFEREMAASFNHGFFVSNEEAALFRRLAPEVAPRVRHFDNGVDFDFFSPEHALDSPFEGDATRLVFTGAMDYWANVDAVRWFATEVLDGVRREFPGAEFWIVGSRPSAEVSALAGLAGVHVTGRVADVRPYLRFADVSVAPMRVARGVQNKVLEALSMGCAVVVTAAGLEGLREGHGLRAADEEPGVFAEAVCQRLREVRAGAHDGARVRDYIRRNYSWEASLGALDAVLPAAGSARPAEVATA